MPLIRNAIKQADDEPDRAAGDLGRREALHRALGLPQLAFEERLRERREQRADDRADDGREDQEGELQRFVCKVRREEAEVGLASQQEARHAEDDDESDAQYGLRQVAWCYSNVMKAPQTSLAKNRPRRVNRIASPTRSSSPVRDKATRRREHTLPSRRYHNVL